MSIPPSPSSPSASVTNRLRLTPGAVSVALSSRGTMTGLFETKFTGQSPRVTSDQTSVQIDYGHFNPIDWRKKSTTLVLNATNPWDIAFDGGVSRCTADLSGLGLRSMKIGSGANHLALVLPQPQGTVQITIDGGAHELSILRPANIPLQLEVNGGTSKLRLDDEEYGAIGGKLRTHTNLYDSATDRYEILIAGGASHIVIGFASPPDVP
jgi:hypothetical protein